MKNFIRRVCGLLAGIIALSAIQMTTVLASASESPDGSMEPDKKEAIVEIVEKTADELVEKTADETVLETGSQELALSSSVEKTAPTAVTTSSNGAMAGTAAWAPTAAWNRIDNSSTYVCGTIKCYTISTNGAKTFKNKTLSTKAGWVDADDEITVKMIAKNASNVWYAAIEYPISNGTKSAFVPLDALSINKNVQAGVEKHARTGFSGVYSRPGVSYPTGGSIGKEDAVYVIGTSGKYTQIMYPTGSTTGNYPARKDNTWKLAWVKSTDAQNYLVSWQQDSSWSNTFYGYSNEAGTEAATISSGGCGLLSFVNAVYHLNGAMIAPETLATFSLNNGCRPNGGGTNSYALITKFCSEEGTKYGIKYKCYADDDHTTLRNCLNNGCVAVAGVINHLIAVVAYDQSDDTYLVFDSDNGYYCGRWLSENALWYNYRGGICNAPVTVIEGR